MHSEFMEALESSPVIAAVKDDDGLKKCLETDSSIVFILYGDICNIPQHRMHPSRHKRQYIRVCLSELMN